MGAVVGDNNVGSNFGAPKSLFELYAFMISIIMFGIYAYCFSFFALYTVHIFEFLLYFSG